MTPEAAIAAYRRTLGAQGVGETIAIRRYTGTGPGRTSADTSCAARVVGYSPAELVGPVLQGDRKLIVLAQDLVDAGFSLPLTANDKAVVRGKELAIVALDDNTRRIRGALIAYELQVRG